MSLTFGSLFAGIGGFDAGFEKAGLRCMWQVESDEPCRRVLGRRFRTERFNDVKEVGQRNLSAVDVICGGFPCQDLSVAGKRAGLVGERSGLWFEFHRILAELRPRWCVIENVPGLLSSNEGRDFAVILRGLVELGYGVAWRILDAQYFGVAQRRRRVFVVGSLGDGSCAQILFESESSSGDSPPRREAGQGVTACVDGSSYADREAEHSRLIAGTLKQRGRGATDEVMDNLQIANAITTGTGKSCGPRNGNGHPLNLINVPDVAWALQERDAKGADSDTKDGHLIIAALLTAGMSATPGVNRPGRRREDDENLVCATLNSGGTSGGFRTEPGEHLIPFNVIGLGQEGRNHAYQSEITGAIQHKGNSASGNEAGTVIVTHALSSEGADASEDGTGRGTPLVAHENKSGQISEAGVLGLRSGVSHSYQDVGVRRLTPTECERLQGFEDEWTASESDSARYRMLGNAVAVPVAEWIGNRILRSYLEERGF